MRPIPFQMILVLTLCTLAFGVGACAKSDLTQGSAGNQGVAASPSTAGSPSPLPQSSDQATTALTRAPVKQKINACGLLTSQEIQSVQGESLKETKASGSAESGFSISQCFFTLPTFNNSISLAVTQKGDGAGARDPKEFWEETFEKDEDADRKSDKKSEKEREAETKKSRTKNDKEKEEEAASPLRIVGVGDEAFWTGSRVGGALYALKGNTYVRVSVGGKGDQQTKINRSKALARLALKRL
jgi:hypothetical protein